MRPDVSDTKRVNVYLKTNASAHRCPQLYFSFSNIPHIASAEFGEDFNLQLYGSVIHYFDLELEISTAVMTLEIITSAAQYYGKS